MQVWSPLLNTSPSSKIEPELLDPFICPLGLYPDLDRPHFQNPPPFGVHKLIIDSLQGIKVVFDLLRCPLFMHDGPSLFLGTVVVVVLVVVTIDFQLVHSPFVVLVDGFEKRGSSLDGSEGSSVVFVQHIRRRAAVRKCGFFVDGPESVHVDAFFGEPVYFENDSRVAFEALSDHPSEGDLREFVAFYVFDGTAADISVTSCDVVSFFCMTHT